MPHLDVLAALPPFTGGTLLTQATLDPVLGVLLVLSGGLYLYGVQRLRARGHAWPATRTLLFIGPGLGSIALVTMTGLGTYDDTLLSVHMVQHMVLAMISPIFLALGAPVTLALRTFPVGPRKRLVAVLHSRVARVLSLPLVSYAIFVANPFVLYFSGLYRLTLQSQLAHEWVHVHFLLTGCLFFWPLLGLDPLPGRWPYPARALLMLLSTPFHAVLGLTIMQSARLIGGDWYPSLHLSWADPHTDQVLGGGILWAGGEVVSVTMLAVLVVQWMREADKEARRVDRKLDRAEAGRRVDPAGAPVPAAAPGPAGSGPAGSAPPGPGAAGSSLAGSSPAGSSPAGSSPAGSDEPVWDVPWWEAQPPPAQRREA